MPNSRRADHLVTVVTGGGSGFGEEICHTFAREGARIVVADLHAENGNRVVQALLAAGHEALFCRVDVSQSAEMAGLVAATLERFGRIDVMVNNAGISHPNQPMLSLSEDAFDRLYRVNVKSIYLSAVHCVPVFDGSAAAASSTSDRRRPCDPAPDCRGTTGPKARWSC